MYVIVDRAVLAQVACGADIDVGILTKQACTSMANTAVAACNADWMCNASGKQEILRTNVYNGCVSAIKDAAAQQTRKVSDADVGAGGFDWTGPDGESDVLETHEAETATC